MAGTGTCDQGSYDEPNWLYNTDKKIDLRLWYLKCHTDGTIEHTATTSVCRLKQMSPISELPICYTPEALKYAQTGFFFSIVIAQISNAFNCKTRKHSFMFGGLTNFPLIFGFCTETSLCLILAFAYPINVALNSRDVTFLHFGIPSIPFSILSLMYDEMRKTLIRNFPRWDMRKPNWYERNHAW